MFQTEFPRYVEIDIVNTRTTNNLLSAYVMYTRYTCNLSTTSLMQFFFLFWRARAVVTIYATLGEDAIAHGINETEVSFVITTHDLLPKFKTILKSTPKVKTIIYMEDQLSETDTTGLREDVNIVAFKEVIRKGESLKIGKLLLLPSTYKLQLVGV